MNAASDAGASEFGAIELFIVTFEGDQPDAGVLSALQAINDEGSVRLVDLVVAIRTEEGDVRVSELAELSGDLAGQVELFAEGLIGEEDIADAVEGVAPGSGIALAALEMRWATRLSSALAAAGGHVAHVALIPGPVVNELVAGGQMASTTGED